MTNRSSEWVSHLADGQLDGDDFARTVTALGEQETLRTDWHVYHLVGEVLRFGAHTPCSEAGAFLTRFQQRLASESAPVESWPAPVPPASIETTANAANESNFRWKMVAGLASLMAVLVVGWSWLGLGIPGAPASAGAQLAQQSPAVAPKTNAGVVPEVSLVALDRGQVMLRDPRLDELIEAHQQDGSVMRMPVNALHNATFSAPSR